MQVGKLQMTRVGLVTAYTTVDTGSGAKAAVVSVRPGCSVVVITLATGISASGTPTDNLGGAYAYVNGATNSGTARGIAMHFRTTAITATGTITITVPLGGSSTGGGLVVLVIEGLRQYLGYPYYNQSVFQTDPANGQPYCNFALTLPTSLIIVVQLNGSGASAVPAGFTSLVTSSFLTPTTHYTVGYKMGGFWSTLATFGTSVLNWCSVGIEITA